MPLSFNISQKVSENPLYNLAVSLPFICAFYLQNKHGQIIIPIFNTPLNQDLTILINIIIIIVLYFLLILYLAIASNFSIFYAESKLYIAFPIVAIISGIFLLFDGPEKPKIGLILVIHVLLTSLPSILLKNQRDNFNLSIQITYFIGTVLSITLFTSGILWYFGNTIFINTIEALFGLETVLESSYKICSIMLLTLGYVVFFGTFQIEKNE